MLMEAAKGMPYWLAGRVYCSASSSQLLLRRCSICTQPYVMSQTTFLVEPGWHSSQPMPSLCGRGSEIFAQIFVTAVSSRP
jgi:hypothetical protein